LPADDRPGPHPNAQDGDIIMPTSTPGGWTEEQRRKQQELSDRAKRPPQPPATAKDGTK
jgi:hypothetical protein